MCRCANVKARHRMLNGQYNVRLLIDVSILWELTFDVFSLCNSVFLVPLCNWILDFKFLT
jgi:hypothetical protein